MNPAALAQQLERLSKAAATLSREALRLRQLLLAEEQPAEPVPEPKQIELPEVEKSA